MRSVAKQNQWNAAAAKLRQAKCTEAPEGFQSVVEIMAETGLGKASAGNLVRDLLKAGAAEKKFRTEMFKCGLRNVPVYRLKPDFLRQKSTATSTTPSARVGLKAN